MEIFCYLKNPGWCGSAGCHLDILKLNPKTGQYESLWWYEHSKADEEYKYGPHTYEFVKILKNKTNGFNDLITVQKNGFVKFKWKGDYYEYDVDPVIYDIELSDEGNEKEQEIAYEFFKKNYKFPNYPLEKSNINLALYDIDHDGEMEILVSLRNRGYEEEFGWPIHILKRNKHSREYESLMWIRCDDRYQTLKDHIIACGQIKILKNSTLGFYDLLIGGRLSNKIYQWRGDHYACVTKLDPFLLFEWDGDHYNEIKIEIEQR